MKETTTTETWMRCNICQGTGKMQQYYNQAGFAVTNPRATKCTACQGHGLILQTLVVVIRQGR